MLRTRTFLLGLALLAACSASESATTAPPIVTPEGDASTPPGDEAGADADLPDGRPGPDAGPDALPDAPPGTANLRLMAANISSGPSLDYTPAETKRLIQGLAPDIAMLQELKVGAGTKPEVDAFVTEAFGATFSYFREPAATANDLPNAVVSRYPIAESGMWVDPQATNRSFVYAKIALPGGKPLWAISVHLLTSNANARNTEATSLVAKIKSVVPASDYVVVGGDFNTSTRGETCITTFSEVFTTTPYPVDDVGNDNTNAPRSKAFDWLLTDPVLAKTMVPVRLGAKSFASGLVFDSRVHTPLTDVAPIQAGDSAAMNMQHMPVVKDFHIGP